MHQRVHQRVQKSYLLIAIPKLINSKIITIRSLFVVSDCFYTQLTPQHFKKGWLDCHTDSHTHTYIPVGPYQITDPVMSFTAQFGGVGDSKSFLEDQIW